MTDESAVRVLYVDDEPEALTLFQRALARESMTVDVADSLAQAQILARTHAYNVIASDMRLVGSDGVKACQALKVEQPLATCILVTGVLDIDLNTHPDDTSLISQIVYKPYTNSHLVEAIDRGIEQYRLRQSIHDDRRATESEFALGSIRLLVLEDNPGDLALVETMLKSADEDYTITPAARLSDAMTLLQRECFDAALVDPGLPDARGVTCIAMLQTLDSGLPIIVMTGLDDDITARQAIKMGAQNYLHKDDANTRDLSREIVFAIERKRAYRRIEYLANHSALTGLPNRVLFHDRLEQALARSDRTGDAVALMFLDLDHFKEINDQWGHDIGDLLLRKFAERLERCRRDSETVAHLSGDEFTVILEGLRGDISPGAAVQRYMDELRAPYRLGDKDFDVGVSAGIALYPHCGNLDHLLKRADKAMYKAKKQGRNQFVIDTDGEAADNPTHTLWAEIDTVLERDELTLHFQPEIRVSDGKVCAVEALLRWQHPTRGMIYPVDFLSLFEDRGIMPKVTGWALTEICRMQQQLAKGGHTRVQMSMNVSARQLTGGIVEGLRDRLEAFELKPEQLALEFSEVALLSDVEAARRYLEPLKELGVSLVLDDFGAGMSSLSCLSRLPFDALKVDRCVVQGVETDAQCRKLAESLIALGHAMGLRVVAEGIETDQQWEFFRGKRCDLAQGFRLAPPMSQPAFMTWLNSHPSGFNVGDAIGSEI